MAFDALKNSTLPRVLGDTFADLADLLQKEFRLAKAEITEKLAAKAAGTGFVSAAALVGLIGAVFVLQAVVLLIASYGIALHWAAGMVGAAVMIVAAVLFATGRSKLSKPVTPDRAIGQIKKDLRLVKEPLR